jgi:VIT1/CCC1 family predicted Fe2+/Mn2+ transporter
MRPAGSVSTSAGELTDVAAVRMPSQSANNPQQQRVLQVVQPALAGMMDGSVSTLAPLFATALATGNSHTAFLVGVAAAVGAGISMAFAEALSDDGSVTGRGNPWGRGLIEGLATMVGGLGHTLPFLLADVRSALPVASVIVVIELLIISWLRFHYFKMSLVRSAVQVVVGGALVFAAGVAIGAS